MSFKIIFRLQSNEAETHHKLPKLISPDADMTTASIRYCGVILLVLCIIGIMYDIKRYVRGKWKLYLNQF